MTCIACSGYGKRRSQAWWDWQCRLDELIRSRHMDSASELLDKQPRGDAAWAPCDHCQESHIKPPTIVVLHLMRSGGHAVRNWLADGFKDTVVINDLHRECSMLNWWNDHGGIPDDRVVVANMEDFGVVDAMREYNHCRNGCHSLRPATLYVLCIRSPDNMFASRWRYNGQCKIRSDDRVLGEWKNYAVAATYTWMPSIVFDNWIRDHTPYAYIIEGVGGIAPNGLHLRVDDAGNGSSFDGTKFDGKANKMDLLNRSRHYQSKLGIVDDEAKYLWQQLLKGDRQCL